MTEKWLNNRSILLRIWQIVTVLTSIYLLVIAFMQYNWYPDNQTPTYNLILGLVFISSIVIRLLRPINKTILLLALLDTALLTIASRAILNNDFWGSLLSLVTTKYGFVALTVYVVDYYLRFRYFNNNGTSENKKSSYL
ncbi:MAG: hypothetical protein KBE91_11260 [Bacteroidia bacterium]|nr:hypothetical protein [Bacteroidia bacterium]